MSPEKTSSIIRPEDKGEEILPEKEGLVDKGRDFFRSEISGVEEFLKQHKNGIHKLEVLVAEAAAAITAGQLLGAPAECTQMIQRIADGGITITADVAERAIEKYKAIHKDGLQGRGFLKDCIVALLIAASDPRTTVLENEVITEMAANMEGGEMPLINETLGAALTVDEAFEEEENNQEQEATNDHKR